MPGAGCAEERRSATTAPGTRRRRRSTSSSGPGAWTSACSEISGRPLSFTLRARSRQDIRARSLSARTPQSERNDRLYEAALRYEPTSGTLLLELGRVGIYNFVGVGYLDGASCACAPAARFSSAPSAGARPTTRPSASPARARSTVRFVRLAPAGLYVSGGYDVALAFVHENAESDVSREYLSLESRFGAGSRWSLFERAELDLNRGWRKELSGSSLQLSNVSLSGTLRLVSSATAFVAYDGRRNYRYYQNRLVPEEVFDDLLHQGLRAGVNVFRPGGFGATARRRDEPQGEGPAPSRARHRQRVLVQRRRPTLQPVRLEPLGRARRVGLLQRLHRRRPGLGASRAALRRGPHGRPLLGRSLYRVKPDEQQRTTQWLRLVGRLELGRHFFAVTDLEYDAGDDLQGPRVYLELGSVF